MDTGSYTKHLALNVLPISMHTWSYKDGFYIMFYVINSEFKGLAYTDKQHFETNRLEIFNKKKRGEGGSVKNQPINGSENLYFLFIMLHFVST